MLAKTPTRANGKIFGLDQLEDTLKKHMPEELVALIDEVTADVEDDSEDGGNRSRRQAAKEQMPTRLGIASTGNGLAFWAIGIIPYPRKKKSLAIGGLLITILGIGYQYLQAHTDQILMFLQQVLQKH